MGAHLILVLVPKGFSPMDLHNVVVAPGFLPASGLSSVHALIECTFSIFPPDASPEPTPTMSGAS